MSDLNKKISNIGAKFQSSLPIEHFHISDDVDALFFNSLYKGKIVQIWGKPSIGKSLFCFHLISKLQETNNTCAYIDSERNYSPEFATSFGVDTTKLITLAESNLLKIIKTLCALLIIDDINISFIFIDSYTALTNRHYLKDLLLLAERYNITIIITNQTRSIFYSNKVKPFSQKNIKSVSHIDLNIIKKEYIQKQLHLRIISTKQFLTKDTLYNTKINEK